MKKIYFVIVIILVQININAQDIKKGFKQLEKSDYAKAKDYFDKAYPSAQNNAAVNFGLMVISADTNSAYYNIVNAWSYAKVVEKNINSMTAEEKEIVAEYFTNTEVRRSSWPVNKKVLQAVGAIEANLIKYIREENNLELAYEVIEKFPDYRYYQNVIHIRNQLEFRKYEKQNTLEGYLEFIKKFPDAAQVPKAIKYRDKQAFEKAKQINTVESYENYMKNYPQAVNYSTAMKMRNASAFKHARQINTIEALDNFIEKYPNALEIADAKKIQRQLLYEYAKKIQTLEAYDEFIHKYPEGGFYIEIFNLKSLDLGMKLYNLSGLNLNNLLWARSFDNKNWPDYGGGLKNSADGHYIVAGNTIQSDSLFEDAWILNLDQEGKMIWNSILGGRYKDSVYAVSVNAAGDIIVLGNTWLSEDSASKENWIFELDKEGRKMWNRTLGKWHITSLDINSKNEIALVGYHTDDSLDNRYSITVINNSGRKLWSRTYTSFGEINDLSFDDGDNIAVAGSHWIFKVTSKGYMLWDKKLDLSDSITCYTDLPDGFGVFAGTRNGDRLILIKVDPKGKILTTKEIDNPNQIVLRKIRSTADGKLLAKGSSPWGDVLMSITADGNILGSLPVPQNLQLNDFLIDENGNLLLQMTGGGNISVFKNSGVVF